MLERFPSHEWSTKQVFKKMWDVEDLSKFLGDVWGFISGAVLDYVCDSNSTKKKQIKEPQGFWGRFFFQDGFKIHGFTIFNSQSPNLGFGSVESSWTGRALLTAQEKNPQLRNGFVHGFSWNMGFSVIGDPVKSSLILMESWHKITMNS